MDVTAVTDSINKKQTNSRIKRSRSITTLNSTSKYIRTTKRRDTITSFINKINVREYFLHERSFANVKIKLSQQIIWCDKALLAAASPVLCEQFRKTNHKDEILTFDDINLDEFLLFLEFIYPLFNPEINEQNISCLIKLSHRFQFDILKHTCQFYVMKYLGTIRCVVGKCHNSKAEGDSFVSNHNDDDDTNESDSDRVRDLIEFHDGTCIDAYNIIMNLCQWLKTYYYENNIIILQSIGVILQKISVENLDQIMNSLDINDEIKVHIYKERAQYLEEVPSNKTYRLTISSSQNSFEKKK